MAEYKDACTLCTHAANNHNGIEGCTECECMATKGEARVERPGHRAAPVRRPAVKVCGWNSTARASVENVYCDTRTRHESGKCAKHRPEALDPKTLTKTQREILVLEGEAMALRRAADLMHAEADKLAQRCIELGRRTD